MVTCLLPKSKENIVFPSPLLSAMDSGEPRCPFLSDRKETQRWSGVVSKSQVGNGNSHPWQSGTTHPLVSVEATEGAWATTATQHRTLSTGLASEEDEWRDRTRTAAQLGAVMRHIYPGPASRCQERPKGARTPILTSYSKDPPIRCQHRLNESLCLCLPLAESTRPCFPLLECCQRKPAKPECLNKTHYNIRQKCPDFNRNFFI